MEFRQESKFRNNITPWLAASLLAILVFTLSTLLLLGSVHAQGVTAEAENGTQRVIADQIDAFRQRDHDRAFSHASPSVKQVFRNTDNFISMVRNGYSPLYNPDSYIFGRNFDLDGTIHQEVIATDSSGKQWQAIYTLKQQEDGSWKITGVKMEPYSGAAT